MAALRYILVGTGGHGAEWCKHFLPRLATMGKAIPVAAADVNAGALAHAREHLKLPADQCYTDVGRAIAENPADFAIVVVPPAHHEVVVDAALKHGLHILSEKPIADTMEGCCRIARKVERAGKKMAVTMSHRFDQDKQTLEREIESGRHGRLNYMVCRFTHNCREFGSWGKFRHEIADPLLVEGTVHHFDIFRALAASDAKRVYAVTWNPSWGEFAGDSTALITLEMMNGVKCVYEGAKANASTMNGWTEEYFRAECEGATLELDRRVLRKMCGEAWDRPVVEEVPLLEREVWMNAWIAEMFCDWLAGRGEAPPTEVNDNLQCSAMLFAAIESARSGKPVDVQEFLRRHVAEAAGGTRQAKP